MKRIDVLIWLPMADARFKDAMKEATADELLGALRWCNPIMEKVRRAKIKARYEKIKPRRHQPKPDEIINPS